MYIVIFGISTILFILIILLYLLHFRQFSQHIESYLKLETQ